MMTKWRALGVASLTWLFQSGLTGCVFGEESEPPVLAIDLYWAFDERSRHDYTCDTVPVAVGEWRLLDDEGEEIEVTTKDQMICDDRLLFSDLDPGDYVFEVNGYNEAGEKAWEATCPVWLDRFDRLFECDIPQIDP